MVLQRIANPPGRIALCQFESGALREEKLKSPSLNEGFLVCSSKPRNQINRIHRYPQIPTNYKLKNYKLF